MNHPPVSRPISRKPGRHLTSSAGAFDLPSILVGVVVVGILTAGVMAAIFGVIPFAQVNAAKQDLAAINTAQGVTYAKDGQIYKDLAGLGGAGLVSGLDAEEATVTTSDADKGFTAIVTAGNGEKWFITHDDPTPRKWTEEEAAPAGPGAAAWASDSCTPAVVETVLAATMQGHPGFVEFLKSSYGLDHDSSAVDDFNSTSWAPFPVLSDRENQVMSDIDERTPSLRSLEAGILGTLPRGEELPDIAKITAAQEAYIAERHDWMMSFCHS